MPRKADKNIQRNLWRDRKKALPLHAEEEIIGAASVRSGYSSNNFRKPGKFPLPMAGHIKPSGLSCKAGGLQRRGALKSFYSRSFITSPRQPLFLFFLSGCALSTYSSTNFKINVLRNHRRNGHGEGYKKVSGKHRSHSLM